MLDSDDAWLPHKLAQQVAALQQHGGYICHSDEIWIRNGRRVNPKKRHAKSGGWMYQQCLPLCAISPSAVMIHRSVLETVGYFDETLTVCEDYDLWLRICARYPVVYIDEPLVTKYGGHADQLSQQYCGMDRFRIRALEKMLQSGHLSAADQQATRMMLQHKINVYLTGVRKRNRTEEITHYESLLARYALGCGTAR